MEIKAYSKQGQAGKEHLHVVTEVEIRTETQYISRFPSTVKRYMDLMKQKISCSCDRTLSSNSKTLIILYDLTLLGHMLKRK
jgi:hypothetical protein